MKTEQHWSETPEGRRIHYSTHPNKPKKGRPYKNPNLVPQGLADYIKELQQENARLKQALADWESTEESVII